MIEQIKSLFCYKMAKVDQEVSSKKLREMVLECLNKMQNFDPDLVHNTNDDEET